MCGFCLAINDESLDIRGMVGSIKHRGPDSTKYFADRRVSCGFNRLAIVDSDSRSDQPMVDESGRYLLLFNGEIYNHNRLRSELTARHGCQFKTRSDTEVLLRGLIQEGERFVSKLDGIFAFAFLDLESLDILLGRDIFGVKPLYYFGSGKRFYVASEVQPLRKLSGNGLDHANITQYLSTGTVGDGGTIVSGVSELQANTIAVFRDGELRRSSSVHDFAFDTQANAEIGEIRDVLYSAIDSQRPDIPYGVLFSGGIDSTLVLEHCSDDPKNVGAYSVDVRHSEMSERHWQEHVIDRLDFRKKFFRVDLGPEHLTVDSIVAISRGLDHPLFHPNFIGSLHVTRRAAENGLKVLLSGEGADELFMGYRWFFADQPLSDFLEYVPLQDLQAVFGEQKKPTQVAGANLLEIFQKYYLPRWLLRQDLTGMANSVEVRVPFLSTDLAAFANRLTVAFKSGNGRAKWILKKILSDKFSSKFVNRRKRGFDFPLNDWIGNEHLEYLRQYPQLIDTKALDMVLQLREGSYMKNRIVFSLVAFVAWNDV
jgi:asparagine synthase (glutamine-hydrolysing)